ncbi:hypothetical protein [Deinococcus sp. UYEF24]
MIPRTLLLALAVLLMGCAARPKTGTSVAAHGTSSPSTAGERSFTTMGDIQHTVDRLMTQQLGFRPSACDTPSEVTGYVTRCFVSVQEPEKLLDEISRLTLLYGEPTMSWRQDVGYWVSIYR